MTTNAAARRAGWTLVGVALALFCVQIDYFAMNLALPRMAADFGTGATGLQWVISVYMLTLGAFMVPAGRIGDIFGRRRALLSGIALFGVASVLCAVAPSAGMLIGFRAVQGLGAALIFPVSVSVLTTAFPPKRASHAIGMAYGIAGLGNAAGPLIGGMLTETVGWRAIFWLNVPFVVISLAIAARNIDESSDTTVPRRIDIAGLACVTAGIGLLTVTFDRAPKWGWLSGWTVATFGVSIVILAAFVVIEKKVRWPLVDLSLAKNSKFSVLVVAGTISNIAYTSMIFLSTIYLQQVRGLDPLTAGLAFLGPSVGAAFGGALSGRLAARRTELVMGIGCVAGAVSLATLAWSRGWGGYLPALTVCGFTLGLVYAFTTVATQSVVRPERAGEAAGVALTSMVTMAGVGVAISGTVLEIMRGAGMSTGGAIDLILVVVAAVLLPAGLVVILIARQRGGAAIRRAGQLGRATRAR